MRLFPQITAAANELLKEIHEQLPQDAGFLFETVLTRLARQSQAEGVLQTIVNELPSDEVFGLIEQLTEDGTLSQEQLLALHSNYPSIFDKDMYEQLLHHFED